MNKDSKDFFLFPKTKNINLQMAFLCKLEVRFNPASGYSATTYRIFDGVEFPDLDPKVDHYRNHFALLNFSATMSGAIDNAKKTAEKLFLINTNIEQEFDLKLA